jgi:tetrahydromethanopterin S-methyltransferase subunit A
VDLFLIYKQIENCIGEICKYLIPIKHEYYLGNGRRFAICTLSSIKLLIEISNDTKLMNKVAIVGRLLSENNGIDKIIKYCLTEKELVHLIVCGKDGAGHRPGNSLIALSVNGITKEGKIIMSKSPYPYLVSSYEEVQTFRDRITIHNLIEETNLNSIRAYMDRLV